LRPVDPDALADRASLLEMARAAAVLVAWRRLGGSGQGVVVDRVKVKVVL
jgi:hypothetical protein